MQSIYVQQCQVQTSERPAGTIQSFPLFYFFTFLFLYINLLICLFLFEIRDECGSELQWSLGGCDTLSGLRRENGKWGKLAKLEKECMWWKWYWGFGLFEQSCVVMHGASHQNGSTFVLCNISKWRETDHNFGIIILFWVFLFAVYIYTNTL